MIHTYPKFWNRFSGSPRLAAATRLQRNPLAPLVGALK